MSARTIALDAVRNGATWEEAAARARMRVEEIHDAVRAWRQGGAPRSSFGARLDEAHGAYALDLRERLALGQRGLTLAFDVLLRDRAAGGWALPSTRDDIVERWSRWGEEHNTLDTEHDSEARAARFEAWQQSQQQAQQQGQ